LNSSPALVRSNRYVEACLQSPSPILNRSVNEVPSYENLAALMAQWQRQPPEVNLFPNVVGYAATADILRLYYSHSGAGVQKKKAASAFDLRRVKQTPPLYCNVRLKGMILQR